MALDPIKQYFGIITLYDGQNEYGYIQCHEIGNIKYKLCHLLNADDAIKLIRNALVLFTIEQNSQDKCIIKEITFDYLDYIVKNCKKIGPNSANAILRYANEETKLKFNEMRGKIILRKKEIIRPIIKIETEEPSNLGFLESILKKNDVAFNVNLIKTLAIGLGDINNEPIFQNAKQLVSYNKKFENQYYPELPYHLYQKANNQYKFKLWLEGIVDFCDLGVINEKFKNGDELLKNEILTRCNADESGLLTDKSNLKNLNEVEDAYFEGISDVILSEIGKAKKNIYVAVAWFTNHNMLEALCEKVKQGVNVEVIILNDYINNWIEGLDFQNFIDLGKEKGNSKFYFCGIDLIMHHKYCIIDNTTLLNGSYNWTYYAEHRNHENCMLFKHKPTLIKSFNDEFERLKSQLEPINEVIPIDREKLSLLDLFSVKQYRSKDIEYQAKEIKISDNVGLVSRLIGLSLQINPENEEALKFQKEIVHPDEEILRKQAIEKELQEKQRQFADLQVQIEEGKRQQVIRDQEEKDKIVKDQREKANESARIKEQIAKQEEQKQKLKKQEEELKVKGVLEEQEKLRLAEIDKQKKLLEEQQLSEKIENEHKQKKLEIERIADQKLQGEVKKLQGEVIAQKQAEQQMLKEQEESLKQSQYTPFQGKRGKLRINLQWKTIDDLDLHVYDPDNNHIFYSHKQATCQSSLGQLDVDANAGSGHTRTPQENIFWDNDAPEGIFKVDVNHFTKRELSICPFVVTIIPEYGDPKVFASKVEGEKNTVNVVTFSYNKAKGVQILADK